MIYLWSACMVVWLAISIYLFILDRRQKELGEDLKLLTKIISEIEATKSEDILDTDNEEYKELKVKLG